MGNRCLFRGVDRKAKQRKAACSMELQDVSAGNKGPFFRANMTDQRGKEASSLDLKGYEIWNCLVGIEMFPQGKCTMQRKTTKSAQCSGKQRKGNSFQKFLLEQRGAGLF